MKDLWSIYASQKGILKKGYFTKHPNRDVTRKAAETSGSNCIKYSQETKEKEKTEPIKKKKKLKRTKIGKNHSSNNN